MATENPTASRDEAPQALGPPGPNPLFFGVVLSIGFGLWAALGVDPRTPQASLDSVLVFRLQVGVAVALVGYCATGALWLAWRRTLYRRVGVGGGALEPPEKKQAEEERDDKIGEGLARTADALDGLRERVESLERWRDSAR